MRSIFFIIRLPFFVLGVWAWLAVGILTLAIASIVVALSPFIVLLWGVGLLGSLIGAAFKNDSKIISDFFQSAWTQLLEDAESLGGYIVDYFRAYYELWKWLLAQQQELNR